MVCDQECRVISFKLQMETDKKDISEKNKGGKAVQFVPYGVRSIQSALNCFCELSSSFLSSRIRQT
jgi:hypothetical protein